MDKKILHEKLVKEISKEIAQKNCFYFKKQKFLVSKTGLYLYKMKKEEKRLRIRQVRKFHSFFSKQWINLLKRKIHKIRISDWIGIDSKDIAFAKEFNPNDKIWTHYFGLDLCGKDSKICDLNSDRTTIVGYQDEFIEVFSKYFPKSKYQGFYYQLNKTINKEYKGIDPKKVFVLISTEESQIKPITSFANRFNYSIGDITKFDSNNIDLVIRQVKTEEILANKKKYSKLLKFLRDGGKIINPLGSYLPGNKGWITIIKVLRLMPDNWFPKTWLISKGMVLEDTGKIYKIEEIIDQFKDKKGVNIRKNYVIKKGFSAGGWKVMIGNQMRKNKWESLWKKIIKSKDSWVVEKKEENNMTKILVGDWESQDDKIITSEKYLNIIQRIYSSSGKPDLFSGEVFGSTSDKVNASGYTFPITIDD
ncbi:hypothetical protein JW887_02980 [Candidatus Dojkabacteria bacterium]|nr:hypothetical protein [Candidatus Dojkabacteria bacterium]